MYIMYIDASNNILSYTQVNSYMVWGVHPRAGAPLHFVGSLFNVEFIISNFCQIYN
jgi:hypothetical protein